MCQLHTAQTLSEHLLHRFLEGLHEPFRCWGLDFSHSSILCLTLVWGYRSSPLCDVMSEKSLEPVSGAFCSYNPLKDRTRTGDSSSVPKPLNLHSSNSGLASVAAPGFRVLLS